MHQSFVCRAHLQAIVVCTAHLQKGPVLKGSFGKYTVSHTHTHTLHHGHSCTQTHTQNVYTTSFFGISIICVKPVFKFFKIDDAIAVKIHFGHEFLSRIETSRVAYRNESCHTYNCVMSHTTLWLSRFILAICCCHA